MVRAPDPGGELVRRAQAYDLVVLGTKRRQRALEPFGEFPLRLAREADRAFLMINPA